MWADDDKATTPEKWEGDNLLGFALKDARQRTAVAER